MTTALALVVLASCALGTYAARSGLILLLADRELPASIERALQYVGPAVLASLTINLAIGDAGVGGVELAEVSALVVAGVVTVWRKNLIWTFVLGMATLWIVQPL